MIHNAIKMDLIKRVDQKLYVYFFFTLEILREKLTTKNHVMYDIYIFVQSHQITTLQFSLVYAKKKPFFVDDRVKFCPHLQE